MANKENKAHQKFFELIKPNHNFEFAGRMRMLLGISLVLVIVSFAMLPINHFWRGHTLNYSIRVLGRRGVLVLNAVANMNQLPAIRHQTQTVLAAVDFNEGHRYTDYLPGTDKAAAYGITGLIIGATAAKAGFFKLLIAGLLAFKKAVVVGVVALVSAIKALFGGKKQEASGTA